MQWQAGPPAWPGRSPVLPTLCSAAVLNPPCTRLPLRSRLLSTEVVEPRSSWLLKAVVLQCRAQAINECWLRRSGGRGGPCARLAGRHSARSPLGWAVAHAAL